MKIPVGIRQKKYSLAALIAVVLSFTQAHALEVGGVITSGSWTAADNPVRIIDNVVLPDGELLNIGPGVRVEFTGPYSFRVEGELRAVGLKDTQIVFTAEHPNIDSLRWKGIRFVNADRGSRLIFCRIEYGWARGTWPENCGGGLYIESSSPIISRCEILSNRSDADGGGIYGWFTTSNIQNNIIARNYSGNFGGGLFVAYSTPQILNCTVAFDTARGWGGGMFIGADAEPTITNCIITKNHQQLWSNQLPPGDEFFTDFARAQSSKPSVSFSCIRETGENVFPGPGNIIANPKFINVTEPPYNYKLKLDSPCIDAGDPGMNPGAEPDILANRLNLGAYGGTEEAALSVPVFFNDLINSDTRLNFSSRRLNSTTSREIRIENHGHYRLIIDSLTFSSNAFFPDSAEVEDSLVPAYSVAPVEPGERMKFELNFKPGELTEYDDIVTFYSNDTLPHPPDTVSTRPVLPLAGVGINPVAEAVDTVNFGYRQVGAEHDTSIYVKNTGDSDLRLTSSSIQGDGLRVVIVDETVAPEDSGEVQIFFEPENATSYDALLTIGSNDRGLSVRLLGIGIGPKMVVEDSTLFLGYVYAGGDTSTYTIPITNEGNRDLVITEAQTSIDAFSVTLPQGGIIIAPTSSTELPVNFHPSQANIVYEDNLVISSNYPLDFTVILSGRGMAEPGKYVFGEISGVWDWIPGVSDDYIVLDSVKVPAHERLKIMPGARILFEPGAKFQSDGELRAVGIPTDSIYFLPRDPSGTTEARWFGIELAHDDNTRLSYCVVHSSLKGIRIRESSPLIQFSLISSNGDSTAEISDHNGGGFYLENSGARITGCAIENNYAHRGGGVYALNSKPTITNCSICLNRSITGGGIYLTFQAGALIQSNLIYLNSATTAGGGIFVKEHSSPRLINNTIVDNIGAGVYAEVRSIPILVNDIVWGNSGQSIQLAQNSNALVSYSDIQGGFRGNANLDTIPGFVDGDGGDYSLTEDSPLIDQGNPEPTYRDYFFPPSHGGSRNDLGAYGGPLGGAWETPEISVAVFQNPAFPRWLDIFVIALDSLVSAPNCSLELGENPPISVGLSGLDPFTYRGEFEASTGGSVFISVDAIISGGLPQKAGRTYELGILNPSEEGIVSIPGIGGEVSFKAGSVARELVLLTGHFDEPLQPADGLIFLTPSFFISGIDEPLSEPARINISFDGEGWGDYDLDRLGIYRYSSDSWQRVEGEYNSGIVSGELSQSGKFVLALDLGFSPDIPGIVPVSINLMRAYPNPFNRKVTIEYTLNQAANVSLSVYNLTGRRIVKLVDTYTPAGKHFTNWDGSGTDGQPLPSGIYWARLDASDKNVSVKLLMLR